MSYYTQLIKTTRRAPNDRWHTLRVASKTYILHVTDSKIRLNDVSAKLLQTLKLQIVTFLNITL